MSDLKLNTVINADCLSYMKTMPSDCINVIITSPPYANQRINTYGGINSEDYVKWFIDIATEIYRILKPTGSFVLNIKEHTNNGRKDTYVLELILALSKIFIWNDTYIWNKTNPFPTGNKKRLKDGFEYCYLFTKTKDYKFNPNNVLIPSTSKYLESEKHRKNKGSHNVSNGSGMNMKNRYVSDMVRPSNVITLPTDTTNHKHPATFPIALPTFFIKLLSDENDVIYDPFCGSGTTLVASKQLNRHYIGTDIIKEYIDISEERLLFNNTSLNKSF